MIRKPLFAALALVALGGCADDPLPTAPDAPAITIILTQNQILYAPAPTTPGAGPGQAGKVTAVTIGKFGEVDCANASGSPSTVRIGCTALLTCTPKCGDRDCTPEEHGARPTFFGTTENAGRVQVFDDNTGNPFNLDAKGLSAGTAKFRCDVLGVSSRDRELLVIP